MVVCSSGLLDVDTAVTDSESAAIEQTLESTGFHHSQSHSHVILMDPDTHSHMVLHLRLADSHQNIDTGSASLWHLYSQATEN